jgi:hypothetical protein
MMPVDVKIGVAEGGEITILDCEIVDRPENAGRAVRELIYRREAEIVVLYWAGQGD